MHDKFLLYDIEIKLDTAHDQEICLLSNFLLYCKNMKQTIN